MAEDRIGEAGGLRRPNPVETYSCRYRPLKFANWYDDSLTVTVDGQRRTYRATFTCCWLLARSI